MITEKAGCFLIKKETKEIALIYRKKQNDYSFSSPVNILLYQIKEER